MTANSPFIDTYLARSDTRAPSWSTGGRRLIMAWVAATVQPQLIEDPS